MSLDWTQRDLREGLRCFHSGAFFEAHEHWESVWLAAQEPEKTFLQGLIRLFFAAPPDLAGLLGPVESFRRSEQARLVHYGDTRKWLDDAQARNPRLPIWKLVLEYGVLQSECRVRWAERALASMTNRNRSIKQ